MHRLAALSPLLLTSALLLGGCAHSGANTAADRSVGVDPSAANLPTGTGAGAGTDKEADATANAEANAQLEHVASLEARILALGDEEPLAMGALGSALVELRPNSLAAHHALASFYQHVDSQDAAEEYSQAFNELIAAALATGDGSVERPFVIQSKADAELLTRTQKRSVVGGIYQSNPTTPLQLLILSRADESSPVSTKYFDLSRLLSASDTTPAGGSSGTANPWDALRILANAGDSAARVAIGTYLTGQRRYDSAVGWLEMAGRGNNLLAHTLLARIFWYQSGQKPEESTKAGQNRDTPTPAELTQKAIDNHIEAIALGSTESMYTLGRMLLEDTNAAEADNKQRALNLLQQAGSLGYADAFLYLASQYQGGRRLPKDEDAANRFFARAAELGSPKAVIRYARYIARTPERQSQTKLLPLLKDLAAKDNPEAMVVIGNLYAKGAEVKRSTRKAVRWYKKAVAQAQASFHGNAAIVNEVAWTLAVTDQKDLQKPDYAQAIMDTMMQNNKQVQNHPEYLDTWAATYAANGNFPKAIELQKRALHFARSQERTDVIAILQTHLESFEAGANITDRTP